MPHKHIVLAAIVILVLLTAGVWYLSSQNDFSGSYDVLVAPLYTPEAQSTYRERVAALAVEADVLVIGQNCAMSPLVLKLSANDMLTIRNDDNTAHTISFEDNNFFSIPAGRGRTFNLTETFRKSEGVYRYKCNDQTFESNVGVLFITAVAQ